MKNEPYAAFLTLRLCNSTRRFHISEVVSPTSPRLIRLMVDWKTPISFAIASSEHPVDPRISSMICLADLLR